MAYRIQYTLLDANGTLSAVVSGKSTHAAAGCIARDIAAQAAREHAERVLVDLRWLEDRVGALRALLNSLWHLRVAVLDVGDSDPYSAFESEQLRFFDSLHAAMRWLRADPRSPGGDSKAPAAAGAPLGAPPEIFGG